MNLKKSLTADKNCGGMKSLTWLLLMLTIVQVDALKNGNYKIRYQATILYNNISMVKMGRLTADVVIRDDGLYSLQTTSAMFSVSYNDGPMQVFDNFFAENRVKI